jgi:hypothetical protein
MDAKVLRPSPLRGEDVRVGRSDDDDAVADMNQAILERCQR